MHHDFVTVTPKGQPWNKDHICERVHYKKLDEAGVRRVRFHDLRHTYASHFVMKGGNINELKAILGHSKIEMTMRYAHLSPDYLLKASNVVGFSIRKKNTELDSDHALSSVSK